MARVNPAADLAARCVTRLQELSRDGTDYPIPLDRLVASVAGDLPLDVRAKAVKQPAFKRQVMFGHARRPDAPVALLEDVERLAASGTYFEFLCCLSAEIGPPWNVAALKKLVPKPLAGAFERSVRDRIAAGDATVALTHDDWLRQRLLSALHNAVQSRSSRPPSLLQLAEQAGCQPLRNGAKLKKIVAGAAFAQHAVTLLDKTLDTPVVSTADARWLANDPNSLITLLTAARTDKKRLLSVRDLLKRASAPIRPLIQAHITECLAVGASLGDVGAIRDGKEHRLFLVQDLEPIALRERLTAKGRMDGSSTTALPAADATRSTASTRPQADRGSFATAFEAAFQRLDAASGLRNQVSLVPLREALSAWSRDEFDAELQHLRLAGQYALSGLQSRDGISPQEQAAGIREAGLLRIYVSRRSQGFTKE